MTIHVRYLRKRVFGRLRHSAKFLSWLAAQATRLATAGGDGTATFTNATNLVTVTGHSFTAGTALVLSTDNTLPAELNDSTAYFVGSISGDDFKLYPTYGDAIAETNEEAFTDDGTGTHTATVYLDAGILFTLMQANQLTSEQVEGLADPFI